MTSLPSPDKSEAELDLRWELLDLARTWNTDRARAMQIATQCGEQCVIAPLSQLECKRFLKTGVMPR